MSQLGSGVSLAKLVSDIKPLSRALEVANHGMILNLKNTWCELVPSLGCTNYIDPEAPMQDETEGCSL